MAQFISNWDYFTMNHGTDYSLGWRLRRAKVTNFYGELMDILLPPRIKQLPGILKSTLQILEHR